eukprot:scaffold23106_cov30-Tisochrysis_lutea.AAC.4
MSASSLPAALSAAAEACACAASPRMRRAASTSVCKAVLTSRSLSCGGYMGQGGSQPVTLGPWGTEA